MAPSTRGGNPKPPATPEKAAKKKKGKKTTEGRAKKSKKVKSNKHAQDSGSEQEGVPQPEDDPPSPSQIPDNKDRKGKFFTLSELDETVVPDIDVGNYLPLAIKESGRKNPKSLC
jgi:hypothetical protein